MRIAMTCAGLPDVQEHVVMLAALLGREWPCTFCADCAARRLAIRPADAVAAYGVLAESQGFRHRLRLCSDCSRVDRLIEWMRPAIRGTGGPPQTAAGRLSRDSCAP